MKRKLAIYQYGSQFDPSGPTRYSPSDWISFSVSEESSPSERSTSIGAPQICTSSSTSDSHADSREDLLTQISFELQRRMDEIGMTLPDGVDFNYFIHFNLLGEEEVGALDPSLLADVLTDLQLPSPIISWYWEEAFKSILLLYDFIF